MLFSWEWGSTIEKIDVLSHRLYYAFVEIGQRARNISSPLFENDNLLFHEYKEISNIFSRLRATYSSDYNPLIDHYEGEIHRQIALGSMFDRLLYKLIFSKMSKKYGNSS